MLTTFHTVDKHFPKKGKKITLETKKAFFQITIFKVHQPLVYISPEEYDG